MSIRSKKVIAIFLALLTVLSFAYAWHSMSMWQSAVISSRDASIALGAFFEASEWLSKRLKQDEIAVVPSPEVFTVLNPQLRYKLVDYESLWRSASVQLMQRGDLNELQRLRRYFIDFLQGNWAVKYVVRDWVELYDKALFDAPVSDELAFVLRESEVVPFTLSTGWSSKITIYEVVRYSPVFSSGLSSPPKQYEISPSNASLQYNWSGATIEKVGPLVGFYLPLEVGVNASRQNYLTMQIKLDVENLELIVAFYFDKNRDGHWSGYDFDYVRTVILDQTKLGWETGKWYKIYQFLPSADDPVVQIGIVAMGNKDGAITLSDLTVYSEITTQDVLIEASNWLSENLKGGKSALVPAPALFSYAHPDLRGKLHSYQSLWASANTTLPANSTELQKFHRYFAALLQGNSSVKYVVRDWIDPYAEHLFESMNIGESEFLLREVKAIFFRLGWMGLRTMKIYEVVQYSELFSMNFSSPPKQFNISPSNASVRFDSQGATIDKISPSIGFYLPLVEGINASNQSHLKIQIKLDAEDLVLLITFYFDKNGDGLFTDYVSDYAKTEAFNQTKLGWEKGVLYTIYQPIPKPDYPNNPIVQIGIFAMGNKTGTITISELAAYTETTAPT